MPPLTAYHRTPVAPSGVSHAVSGHFVSSELLSLVTARDNKLSLWTVSDRLEHVRTTTLHGEVTSLSSVRTLQSKHDKKDRLLVSFHQAKMSLLEWNDQDEFGFVPVSLHTFEKLPQVADDRETLIAHDPASRMTVLHLATNSGGDGTLAVLPWFTEELDLEGLGMDREGWEQGGSQIPYAPSHLIPLTSLQPSSGPGSSSTTVAARSSTLSSTSSTAANAFLPNGPPPIRNLVGLTFLPGFTEPTLALLYAPDWTWSGRLEHLAHNHLVSLVTLSTRTPSATATSSSKDKNRDKDDSPTSAILISTSPPLPYSLVSIQPLPPSLGIGSVLLTSANGLLLLDIQGGKLVGVESTKWLARDFPPGRPVPVGVGSASNGGSSDLVGEPLEGSVVHFLGDPVDESPTGVAAGLDNEALVFCRSGAILRLRIERVGRSISGMKLDRIDRGSSSSSSSSGPTRFEGGASCTVWIGRGKVFVASEQGKSWLVEVDTGRSASSQTVKAEQTRPNLVEDVQMDEDDEDIYGTSTTSAVTKTNVQPTASRTPVLSTSAADDEALRLRVLDELEGWGSIRSVVMGLVDDESPAELVGATGAGRDAGLTIFHRSVPSSSRRAFPLPASTNPSSTANGHGSIASDGIWRIDLGPKAAQGRTECIWIASGEEEDGTAMYQSTPGQPLELVKLEPVFRTVYATAMGTGDTSAIVLVGTGEIRVFDRDLNPLQTISLSPAIAANASARATSTPSYLALHVGSRSSVAPRLYRFEESIRSLVEVDSEQGGNGSGRIAVWRDVERKASLVRPAKVGNEVEKRTNGRSAATNGDAGRAMEVEDDEDEDLYGASAAEQASGMQVDAGDSKESLQNGVADEAAVRREDVGNDDGDLLARVNGQGTLTISLLPSNLEVFRCPSVTLFHAVLSDSPSAEPSEIPESIDPDDLVLDRIQLVTLGSSARPEEEKLHLLLWNSSGTLVLYEAFAAHVLPSSSSEGSDGASLPPRLALRFVKMLVHHVPLSTPRRKGSNLPIPARRELVSFSSISSASPQGSIDVGSRSGHAGVFVTGEETYWIVKGRQGPARCFEGQHKACYGFAEAQDGDFATMTREGLHLSTIPHSVSLNHSMPISRVPKDRTYSYITFDLDSGLYVGGTLNETQFVAFDEEGNRVFKDTEPGLLDPTNYQSTLELLAPGTWEAIDGYEFRQNEFICTVKTVSLHSQSKASGLKDFIAVGTTVYRGEDLSARGGIYIFEVVKINAHPATPRQDHVLKLRFFEDTKSIVGNICDLNGYLFMSMGQKLYARALEQDEVLLAVGFLDLGVHVTSLTALKNFLLIGDAMQSVALVAFQEDPYKLVFLGRDYRPSRVSNANFLVNEGRVAFVTGDDKGVIRLFEYDPSNIASHAGQRLLCRTEYHAGPESVATMVFAKHVPGEDPKQNGILFGGIDGSLYTLVPVRDAVFRRLQSLQTMMTRHVLHFGGLNPRGHRIVKNDTVSRAIVKGVLDGDLLAQFEYLALDVQTDLAAYCQTDVDTVLANLRNLRVLE